MRGDGHRNDYDPAGPKPTATPTASLCYGQSVQLQGGGGVSYQWSPATYLSSTTIPDPVVQQPQKSITYSLNVTGVNGCTSVQPALTLVVVTPPPVVFAGDDTAVLVGQTLPLDAVDVDNSGFTSYQWSPAIGLDILHPGSGGDDHGGYHLYGDGDDTGGVFGDGFDQDPRGDGVGYCGSECFFAQWGWA